MFADAKPSEAIQKHELPGLSVACLLPIMEGKEFLDVPIKQYKEYKPRNRVNPARALKEWLAEEREKGLIIAGFSLSRTQTAAARFGLDLIEELPDTRVEPHHNSFRLFFGDEPIDFAQAVALIYYNFAMNLAILRASCHAPEGHKKFVVFMDRFPGASAGDIPRGQRVPTTQGMKFIQFIREHSKTAIEIDKTNAESGIEYKSKTLAWWRPSPEEEWITGKGHPHFVIADWFVAAALAHEFEQEFIETYPHKPTGEGTAKALIELFHEFKRFSIWSIADDNTLAHIVSNEKQWTVSVEAREFIMSRAEQ